MPETDYFDGDCRACARLSAFLDAVRDCYPEYHARPVAPFGVADPRLLIVGLAPGLHGANATGRPFTGDFAGTLLYNTLYKFGFSSRAESRSATDDLNLIDCRITNAVKCLPPQNKPLGAEIKACNGYLRNELNGLKHGTVILALGAIAHKAVLSALGLRQSAHPFIHGGQYALPGGRWLVDSYHCSRYNTQTRRLSEAMFGAVFSQIRNLLSHAD